jgi:hypothetical protein
MFEAQTKPMTLDEFIAIALLPENAERNLEFINGEIFENMPGSTENSGIAANLIFETRLHCQVHNLPCLLVRATEHIASVRILLRPISLTSQHR